MSKEVSKDLHECHLCGRLSKASSVLRETKDKKGVSSWHCVNGSKCKEDQKNKNLVNGKRPIIRAKKVVVKKGNGKQSKELTKKVTKLKAVINEEPEMVEAI